MLRELIDIAVLEDFVAGLAWASGLRTSVYGVRGELIGASPRGRSARTAAPVLKTLPARLKTVDLLPARELPAGVAFVEQEGLWTIVVPVYIHKNVAGFVGVGAFRDPEQDLSGMTGESRELIEKLPVLPRVSDARSVVIARWASRLLADWCLSGVRLGATAEEVFRCR